MKKQIICIINGKGGIGKDTLISALEGQEKVANISSIDPIRPIAEKMLQMAFGESSETPRKTLPYRKLLADVKSALDSYYEATKGIKASTYYLKDKVTHLSWFDVSVLFLHVREPENIAELKDITEKFFEETGASNHTAFTTLLVKSSRAQESYGNPADDNAENYPYDYIYESEGDIVDDAEKFRNFFAKMRKELENG